MQCVFHSEAELIESIYESSEPTKRVTQMLNFVNCIIEGRTRVVSLASNELYASTVFANLLSSLDVALKYELVSWANERAKRILADIDADRAPAPIVIENLLASASILLPGQSMYNRVIEFGRSILDMKNQISPRVQLEGARLLYDADALGDSSKFWMDLCSSSLEARSQDTSESIAYVALSALMRKWPKESLNYLLEICAVADEHMTTDLANLISISAEEITNGVSFEQFSCAFDRYSSQMSQGIREALEDVAAERGWLLSQKYIPDPVLDVMPINNLNSNLETAIHRILGQAADRQEVINKVEAIKYGGIFARICEFGNSVFPTNQIRFLKLMRHYSAESFDQVRNFGMVELQFVRQAVEDEVNRRVERDYHLRTYQREDEVLLEAVNNRFGVNDFAVNAVDELKKLGFNDKPFFLGASEFHQDRLLMNVVAAALRSHGLMGTQVASRRWEERGLWLKNGKKGHVKTKAEIVLSPTQTGVLKFNGFKVFLRLDALVALLTEGATPEVQEDVALLIKTVENNKNIRDVLDLRTRARLVLRLGDVDAKGSAFEELRGSLERVARLTPGQKSNAVIEVTNDDAFEAFITGQSCIYCGGAINSLLIETWWKENDSKNFVEVLNHEEIASGFVAKRGKAKLSQPYVENALHFDFGDREGSTSHRMTKAEINVTNLFRAVGRGLQLWSNEVMSKPDRLNGSKKSCEAACNILRPLKESQNGRYAFTTNLTDPARLIHTSDQFYSV